MNCWSLSLALAPLLAACGSRDAARPAQDTSAATHARTEIPIDINTLSDEQRALIQVGNEADDTPYLMRSRPIVCQIVEATDDADEVRTTGPLLERAEVMIYAQGEADGDRLVDRGWIEDLETGEVLWEMTPENSVHGGGDARNRKAVARLWLEPGRYRLRYVSDSAHAYGDWRGDPPERELFYGIVVFNLAGIRAIEQRFRDAGLE